MRAAAPPRATSRPEGAHITRLPRGRRSSRPHRRACRAGTSPFSGKRRPDGSTPRLRGSRRRRGRRCAPAHTQHGGQAPPRPGHVPQPAGCGHRPPLREMRRPLRHLRLVRQAAHARARVRPGEYALLLRGGACASKRACEGARLTAGSSAAARGWLRTPGLRAAGEAHVERAFQTPSWWRTSLSFCAGLACGASSRPTSAHAGAGRSASRVAAGTWTDGQPSRAQQSLSTSAATQCNYGTHAGRCVICGAAGAADAYYCKECVQLEKDRDGCPKIINLGSSKTDLFFRCDTRELLSVLRTLLRCSGTDTVSRSVSLSLGRVAIVSAWAVARKRASAFGGKTKLCRFSDGCDRVCAQRSRALPRLTRDGADR